MPKITTYLTFESHGLEAVNFYLSIFPGSKMFNLMRDDDQLLNASFELNGSPFMAMDGGPDFKFDKGISLSIACETQAEVDHYWEALIADGGTPGQCGWLKDKYGVSWTVIPNVLGELMMDPDRDKANRVREAMLKMGKLDISGLQKAAHQV